MEPATAPALPPFRRYANQGGHSGVAGYALVDAGIAVRFANGATYLYDHHCPGQLHVARMKSLARAGSGLATYISRHVGRRYATRLDPDPDGDTAAPAPAHQDHRIRQNTAFR